MNTHIPMPTHACVQMHVCTYAHTSTHMHAFMLTWMFAYIRAHIYSCTPSPTHAPHTHTHTSPFPHMHPPTHSNTLPTPIPNTCTLPPPPPPLTHSNTFIPPPSPTHMHFPQPPPPTSTPPHIHPPPPTHTHTQTMLPHLVQAINVAWAAGHDRSSTSREASILQTDRWRQGVVWSHRHQSLAGFLQEGLVVPAVVNVARQVQGNAREHPFPVQAYNVWFKVSHLETSNARTLDNLIKMQKTWGCTCCSSLSTSYLLACQVRVTLGDSGLCCCVCVTSFEC